MYEIEKTMIDNTKANREGIPSDKPNLPPAMVISVGRATEIKKHTKVSPSCLSSPNLVQDKGKSMPTINKGTAINAVMLMYAVSKL